MTSKTIIHKLLYRILLDIRVEAYSTKNNAKIFHLADLFHNIPLQLEQADETGNYDDLIEWLVRRAKEKGCEQWLVNQIESVKLSAVNRSALS